MAYERLNLIDDDVLKAEHISHMEDGIERANDIIVSSGSPDTLTWDGDVSKFETVETEFAPMYLVTSAVPDVLVAGSSEPVLLGKLVLSDSTEYEVQASGDVSDAGTGCFWVNWIQGDGIEAIGTFAINENTDMLGVVTIPKIGFYIDTSKFPVGASFTINGYTGFINEQLDKKYLPMDYITEAVISKLPVYNGEVV